MEPVVGVSNALNSMYDTFAGSSSFHFPNPTLSIAIATAIAAIVLCSAAAILSYVVNKFTQTPPTTRNDNVYYVSGGSCRGPLDSAVVSSYAARVRASTPTAPSLSVPAPSAPAPPTFIDRSVFNFNGENVRVFFHSNSKEAAAAQKSLPLHSVSPPCMLKDKNKRGFRLQMRCRGYFAVSNRLLHIPGLTTGLGRLFKTSGMLPLTDSVAEYIVSCAKHVFSSHMLLEFECKVSMKDQLLLDVSVEVDDAKGIWKPIKSLPIDRLPYGEPKSAFVILPFPDSGEVAVLLTAKLVFNVLDVDPTTGEPDSGEPFVGCYDLEDVEVTVGDSVFDVAMSSFARAWTALDEVEGVERTFNLSSVSTLTDAIKNICKLLGLAPCKRSDIVPEGKTSHTALLSGRFRGDYEVLAKVNVRIDPIDNTIGLNILIRSPEQTVAAIVASAIK